MASAPTMLESREGGYRGLRMSAREYFALKDDGNRYELVDGVVCMSPSPTPKHQSVIQEISLQIGIYLREHPVGRVFVELDAPIGQGPTGGDLVYRPDVVFVSNDDLRAIDKHLEQPPSLVVEVVSPDSRRFDHETKMRDYEKAGVHEYWVIDPERETFTFYRLQEGRFVEVLPTGDSFRSEAVNGFTLEINRVRDAFTW